MSSDEMSRDERTAWIALSGIDGIGERTFERLLEVFGSGAAALEVLGGLAVRDPDGWLAERLGVRVAPGLATAIRDAARDPGRDERRMAELGGWTLTPFDEGFPDRLGDLDPPPRVLHGLGEVRALGAPRAVAVVGTRRATAAGRAIAARVADRLVAAGAVVVSGLAVGVDGAAHAATVEAGGTTVAVVGGGLARPGPRAHRHLARAIRAGRGAVVSELRPDAVPTRGTFPRRNRIISGLADATLVIEAPARSGALITARHALEQGRPLLVAPGRPFDPVVAGCLALLRETPARPLVGLDELLVDLGYDQRAAAGTGSGRPVDDDSARALGADAALALLEEPERRVATRIVTGPASVDAIVAATGLSPAVVAAALTILQLRGWAQPSGALFLPAGPLRRADRAGAASGRRGRRRAA
jgi:DNA processing protein